MAQTRLVKNERNSSFVRDDEVMFLFEPSVLMQIYKVCRKGYPAHRSGSVLGIRIEEDGSTSFDVTDSIPTTDRTLILNVAKFIGSDCEQLGFFKSSEGVDHQAADLETIRILRTAAEKSPGPHIMIICDPLAGNAIELQKCFKAVRLGPDRETPLVPIEIQMNPTSIQKSFIHEWSLSNPQVYEAMHTDISPLKNVANDPPARKLNSIYRSLEETANEQQSLLKYLSDVQRHEQRIAEWMEKRRLENQNRFLEDREPLAASRDAAIKALGDVPALAVDADVKAVTVAQNLMQLTSDLKSNQKEAMTKQKILSQAFET